MTRQTFPLKCRIRAEGGVTRVDIYDDIGPGFWDEGLTAKSFAGQLAEVRGPLEVHVNSGGGDVYDGLAIGEAIRSHKGPVTVCVDGIAASIASVIVQAAQQRVMAPGSMMMIHEPFGVPGVVNPAESAKFTAALEKNAENIAAIYARKAGGASAAWRAAMQAETWYTAEEAVAAGLADRVAGTGAALPAGLDLAAFAPPGRIAAALRSMPQAVIVNADGNHAPMTGTHTHSHPAYGSQGSDSTHSHEHEHHGDANHGHGHYDPDHDGDDDSSAAGDTDHDYVLPDGKPGPKAKPGNSVHPAQLHALAHTLREILAADVDHSEWDADRAWHNGAASDDPAAFYKGICAGRKSGDPSKQSSWALPYKYAPSSPPNAAGVRNALARLPQTQGLTNEAEARSTLEAAMKKVNPDWSPNDLSETEVLAMFARELDQLDAGRKE